MTAADKLRELLASRPALPGTEELVRWWRTSAVLLSELFVEQRDDLVVERAKLRREQDARSELRVELDRVKAERDEARRQLAAKSPPTEPAHG